jgi:hypothetical protein
LPAHLLADVAPPITQLTRTTCHGEMRRCGGGDTACRQQAEREGYEPISLYGLCRREDVGHELTPSGYALVAFGIVLGVVLVAAILLQRRRRQLQ